MRRTSTEDESRSERQIEETMPEIIEKIHKIVLKDDS